MLLECSVCAETLRSGVGIPARKVTEKKFSAEVLMPILQKTVQSIHVQGLSLMCLLRLQDCVCAAR